MAQRKRRRCGSGVEAAACGTPDIESHAGDPTVTVQSVIMAEVDSASDDETEEVYAAVDAAEKEAEILKVCAHCVRSASPVYACH